MNQYKNILLFTASTNAVDGTHMPSLGDLSSLNSVPSPLRVESPHSPMMLPPIPPPPFIPHLMGPPGSMSAGLPGVPPPHFIPPPIGQAPPDYSRPLGRLVSPPPNRYSPSIVDSRYSPDSRYHDDYSVMSRYDTETDFSPPPSPPKYQQRNSGGGNGDRYRDRPNGASSNNYNKAYSPTSPKMNGRNRKSNKGTNSKSSSSSSSFDSFNETDIDF